MARWAHTYREGQITPDGTITEARPGHAIAKAITEIQEKAVTDATVETSGNIQGEVEVSQGVVQIRLSVPESTEAVSDLPDNGEIGMVLTRGSSSKGVDGWVYWDYIRAVELP